MNQPVGPLPPGLAATHMVAVCALLPADTPRLGGVDEQHVRALAETEAVLPPILVHSSTLRVIDGMHRVHAALLKGQPEIEARFFHGTDEQAFMRAVRENTSHGLPLSAAERRAAACRIMTANPQLSDRGVAAATGLSARTIAALRRRSATDVPQLNSRIGIDGRWRPSNGSAGRHRAALIIAAHPSASLRAISRAAGISVGTAHDVRARLRRGESPLGHGQAAARSGENPGRAIPPSRHRDSPIRAQAFDSTTIVRSLMNDPSLRYTESGRDLLRWLRSHAGALDAWPAHVGAVPPHCAGNVAELARQSAAAWNEFAQALSQRADTTQRAGQAGT